MFPKKPEKIYADEEEEIKPIVEEVKKEEPPKPPPYSPVYIKRTPPPFRPKRYKIGLLKLLWLGITDSDDLEPKDRHKYDSIKLNLRTILLTLTIAVILGYLATHFISSGTTYVPDQPSRRSFVDKIIDFLIGLIK